MTPRVQVEYARVLVDYIAAVAGEEHKGAMVQAYLSNKP